MPYIWVFNGNMVTSPILEMMGKVPIIPRSPQTSARRELHFLMNHPNLGPWRASQGKCTKAKFPGHSEPTVSHISEEEVMPLFYRWFEDTSQLFLFYFSLVPCFTPSDPSCKEITTFKICGVFSKEPV